VAFTLRSPAFDDGDAIPVSFTCDGANRTPPLTWSGPPPGTRSFAVIVDDPDAPGGTFTHWLIFDIPADVAALGEESDGGRTLPNDFGHARYDGPCPPRGHGPHRYDFTIYAVDVPALDLHGKSREALDRALAAHTLATARLSGRFERKTGA
jgi:hypothetical protein